MPKKSEGATNNFVDTNKTVEFEDMVFELDEIQAGYDIMQIIDWDNQADQNLDMIWKSIVRVTDKEGNDVEIDKGYLARMSKDRFLKLTKVANDLNYDGLKKLIDSMGVTG